MNNTSFMEKLLGLSDRQAGGGFSFPPSSMHTVLLSDSVCIPTQERGNELNKENVEYIAKSETLANIAANDYNLSVSNYVEAKDTHEVIDITELNAELKTTVAKIDQLCSDIDAFVAEIEA